MRPGVVCVLIVVLATNAGAQRYTHDGSNSFAEPVHSSVVRADGTNFEPTFQRPRTNIPASISYRHYTHEPPTQARQHVDKALKALRAHHDNEALTHLAAAAQSDPDYFEAHAHLGMLYLKSDQHAEALTHLEQALAIDPSSQLIQELTAGTLLQLGRYAEAETAAKRARQLGRPTRLVDEVLRITTRQRQANVQTTYATR